MGGERVERVRCLSESNEELSSLLWPRTDEIGALPRAVILEGLENLTTVNLSMHWLFRY